MLTGICHAEVSAGSHGGKAQEFYLENGDGKLYGTIMGKGSPLIVIHGGAGYLTHDYLLPAMAQLTKNHTTIFYDQRGLGRSSSPISPEQINITAYIKDLESIRKFLGFPKVSVLGHSWGGFVAMHYALVHPESLDKIVLVGSMPASSDEFFLFLNEINRRLLPFKAKREALENSPSFAKGDPATYEEYLRTTFQTYFNHPEDASKLNLKLDQDAIVNGLKVWEIFKEQILQPYDLYPQLTNMRAPTLIIHGDVDPIPLASAVHLHQVLPCSQFFKIEQSGHFPYVEQPDQFFERLEAFLLSD